MDHTSREFAHATSERNLAHAIRDTAREYRRLAETLDTLERRAGELDPSNPEAYKIASEVARVIASATASATPQRVVAAAGEFDAVMNQFGRGEGHGPR